MDYNTERNKILLPEYGRMVQNMVEHALTITNRAERQTYAETIINVMANLFPQNRNVADFKHKLWDHLAFISDYQLDIDYPYGQPERKTDNRPGKVPYPSNHIRFRHYGKLLEEFISYMDAMPEGEEKKNLSLLVGLQMRRSLAEWNKDANDNEKVVSDLARYTEGRMQMSPDELSALERTRPSAPAPRNNKGRRNKRFM